MGGVTAKVTDVVSPMVGKVVPMFQPKKSFFSTATGKVTGALGLVAGAVGLFGGWKAYQSYKSQQDEEQPAPVDDLVPSTPKAKSKPKKGKKPKAAPKKVPAPWEGYEMYLWIGAALALLAIMAALYFCFCRSDEDMEMDDADLFPEKKSKKRRKTAADYV